MILLITDHYQKSTKWLDCLAAMTTGKVDYSKRRITFKDKDSLRIVTISCLSDVELLAGFHFSSIVPDLNSRFAPELLERLKFQIRSPNPDAG